MHDLKEDYMFPNSLNCPYYTELFLDKLNLFTKYKDYMANLIELTRALKTPNQAEPNVSFTSFRDDMVARKVHGLPVPEHLETLTVKSDRYANIELSAMAE